LYVISGFDPNSTLTDSLTAVAMGALSIHELWNPFAYHSESIEMEDVHGANEKYSSKCELLPNAKLQAPYLTQGEHE